MRSTALLLGVLLGCSSSEFTVADTNTDTGAAAADSAVADTAADTGAIPEDTQPAIDARPDTPPITCTPQAENPPTVYVDKKSTRPSKGTMDCPYHSIQEAIAYLGTLLSASGKHTIRVTGGPVGTPHVYNEPMLVLKQQITLQGDGPGRVTITGGGKCGDGTCMVVMEGGASLEGITIDAKGEAKTPLAIGAGILTFVSVKAVTLTGTIDKSTALYIDSGGFVELGPELRIVDTGGSGIYVKNSAAVKLSGLNYINRNALGIYMLAGKLDVIGPTEIIGNKSAGIALAASDKNHVIDGAIITDNAAYGVYVDGAGLKMRNTKLVKNDIGLVFRFAAGAPLDLGNALGPGGNYFGGSDTNKRAAICFPNVRTMAEPARGNSFKSCPPSFATILEGEKACDAIPGDYRDIYYATPPAGAPTHLDTMGCFTK